MLMCDTEGSSTLYCIETRYRQLASSPLYWYTIQMACQPCSALMHDTDGCQLCTTLILATDSLPAPHCIETLYRRLASSALNWYAMQMACQRCNALMCDTDSLPALHYTDTQYRWLASSALHWYVIERARFHHCSNTTQLSFYSS